MDGLARFRSQKLAVAINTSPVAVDERHGIAADWAIGRRSFVESGKNGQLNIVFIHNSPC